MISPDFAALAYERQIVRYLKKYLIERCLPDNGSPPKESLVCDDLPFSDRDIPLDAVLGMVQRLVVTEDVLSKKLGAFVHIQNVVHALEDAPKSDETTPSPRPAGEKNEPKSFRTQRKPRKAQSGGAG